MNDDWQIEPRELQRIERTASGLLRVTMGGAQLRALGDLCNLCAAGGRCRQFARLTIEAMEGPGGGADVVCARRYCDGQAIFAGIAAGPRPAA